MDLREGHRRLVGPEATQGHLQAGLVALTAGVVLGLAGVGLYLLSESLGGQIHAWRKAAIALAAASPPLLFAGISLALPARLALRGTAAGGALLHAAAIVLFLLHYPQRFNVSALGRPDQAPLGAAVYALGAAVMVAVLLAQIVGVYVRGRQESEEDWWTAGYEVSDRTIERDIDEAMARHPVEWGAAPRPASGVEVRLPGFGRGAVVRGQGAARRTLLAVPELEAKSDRLRGLTAATVSVPGEGMLSATEALGDLRRRMAADPKKYRPPRPSWWRRIWRRP